MKINIPVAKIVNRVYCEIWYHFEGLWTRSRRIRRPFTYIMRDFQDAYPYLAIPLYAAMNAGMVKLIDISRWWLILFAFWWALWAHLNWGTPRKKGEQESPQYIEKNS